MQINVVFTREVNPDFVSRAVMMKDNTDYSHVLIEYIENGTKKIFHSVGEGVCVVDESYYKDHIKAHEFNVDLKVSDDFFFGFIQGSLGKDYSQSQIAAIAVGKVEHNGNEKMICSELVYVVLRDLCGFDLSMDQDGVRPYHVYDIVSNSLKS